MKVVVSNDKSGYSLKEAALEMLKEGGHEVIDLGTNLPEESLGHPIAAQRVAESIQSGQAERGLLFCGTGMGVSLAANKYKGIKAGVCESVFTAKYCRMINDCNVLCTGAYIIGNYMGKEMIKAFMSTDFCEGFEESRAANLKNMDNIISEFEQKNFR